MKKWSAHATLALLATVGSLAMNHEQFQPEDYERSHSKLFRDPNPYKHEEHPSNMEEKWQAFQLRNLNNLRQSSELARNYIRESEQSWDQYKQRVVPKAWHEALEGTRSDGSPYLDAIRDDVSRLTIDSHQKGLNRQQIAERMEQLKSKWHTEAVKLGLSQGVLPSRPQELIRAEGTSDALGRLAGKFHKYFSLANNHRARVDATMHMRLAEAASQMARLDAPSMVDQTTGSHEPLREAHELKEYHAVQAVALNHKDHHDLTQS